jgi:outer membrane protein assembly factor BamB
LVCLDAKDGRIHWQHNLLQEFQTPNISWGLCTSPLVEGDLVLTVPGSKEAGVAAFHKETGNLAWKAGRDKAAYASPVALTAGGVRQAVFFTAGGLLSVDPKSGKELWQVPWVTEFDVNICTPLVIGDQLFVSSGEKVGCALFKVAGSDKPSVVWESKGSKSVMITYWANAVAHGGYLYGLAGEYTGPISLRCVELATGKQVWSKDRFGFGNLALADGHLWVATAKGELVLAEATPDGYKEKGRSTLLADSRYATVPAIAGGKLFLRDREHVYCLDIAGR